MKHYVVSANPDRRDSIRRELEFAGIDPQIVESDDAPAEGHARAWRRIALSAAPGGVVLEDCARFTADPIRTDSARVPAGRGADIVMLGHDAMPGRGSARGTFDGRAIRPTVRGGGTEGYWLSRFAAKRLLQSERASLGLSAREILAGPESWIVETPVVMRSREEANMQSSRKQRTQSWVFPEILSPEFCRSQRDAMRDATPLKPGKVQTGGGLAVASVRRSDVGFVDPARHEICRQVRERVFEANRDAGWLAFLSDKVEWQFTRYGERDAGFYKPHQDSMAGGDTGLDRKLSCVVQLSERESYEGGEFSLPHGGPVDQRRVGGIGTVIVFPSYVVHAVSPVTKGERFSLVSWHWGPNWR